MQVLKHGTMFPFRAAKLYCKYDSFADKYPAMPESSLKKQNVPSHCQKQEVFIMAFSDYKNISQVQKRYTIRYEEANFIAAQRIEPPAAFAEEFEISREHIDIYVSEGSRSEIIIFPILREVWKNYRQTYSLWVQKRISYDDDLTGIPDYIIATRSPLGKTVLESPLLIAVEAKKNDFGEGWDQCLAELDFVFRSAEKKKG